MHRLPKPMLVPLCIKTPAIRRDLREHRDSLTPGRRRFHDAFHAACAARLDRERPWRIMNQRRRLSACHWADWKPAWLHPASRRLLKTTLEQRHGDVGRKWLGGRP